MSFTPSSSRSRMTPAKTPRSWAQVLGIMPSTKKRRTETVEPSRDDDGMSSNAPVVQDLLSQYPSMTPRSNGKKRVPQLDFSKGDPKEQALAEQKRLAADKETSLTIYNSTTAPSSAFADKRRDGPQFSLGSRDLSRKSAMSRKMRYKPNARGLIGNRSVGATYQRRNNAVDIPTLRSVLSTLEPSFTQEESQALKTVKSVPGKVQYGNSQRLSRLPKPSEKSSRTRQQHMAIRNQTEDAEEDHKQRKKVQFQSSGETDAVVSFVPTTPATTKGYGSRLSQRERTPMPNAHKIGTSETIDSVDYHDDDADDEEIATPSSTASKLLMTKPKDFVLELDGPYKWTAEIKPFDLSAQEPLRDVVQFKWTSDTYSQKPLPTGDLESFEAGKYDESAESPKKPKPKMTPKRASPKESEPAEQSAKRAKQAGSPGKPSMKPEDAQPLGWGNIFKDQHKGKWKCPFCFVYNSDDLEACISCESPRPETTKSKKSTETKKNDSSSKPAKKTTSQFVFGAPTPSLPVPTGKPVEDKFSFGSSLPASTSPAPKFMFGSIPSSTTAEPSKPTTLLGSTKESAPPAAAGFVFGGTKTSASASTVPAKEADKPTFSFGSVDKAKEEKKPTFSFGTQSTPVTPAPAPSTTAISFEKAAPSAFSSSKPAEPPSKPSFGSFADKPTEPKGEKPSFSFGSQQNTETSSFKPSFSFGSNANDSKNPPPSFGSSSAPIAPKVPQNESSGANAAFGGGKSDTGSKGFVAPTAPAAAAPIVFGKKAMDPPAATPNFSFGASPAATPAPAKLATPSLSAPSGGFAFGGAQSTTASTSNGGSLGSFTKTAESTDGASRAKRSRGGAASNGVSDQSTTTGFGSSAVQGTSFGVSAPAPAFAFGKPSTQGQETTGSAPAFSFGSSGASAPPSTPAPAPPVSAPTPTPAAAFQFGAATTATPAPSAPPTSSQPGFTFGQSASKAPPGASQNPAPNIQFGQSSATVAAPNPFGGTPAPMGSAAPQQQPFTFGGPPKTATTPATPAFGAAAGGGFGGAPPMTAPPASSGFGGPSAGGFNSMLPGNSNTPMAPGGFGNSASTPATGGFSFGSQAAGGVGGFPPVASQTPLQAAPSQMSGFGVANSAGFGATPATGGAGFGATPATGGGFNIGSSTGRQKRTGRRILKAKRPG